jgi:hypothetical protein
MNFFCKEKHLEEWLKGTNLTQSNIYSLRIEDAGLVGKSIFEHENKQYNSWLFLIVSACGCVNKRPFYGALAFVQNKEPFTSRAAKERVISLKFLTDDLGAESKQAFDSLIAIDE